MPSTPSTRALQFNEYKYNEMYDKLTPLLHEYSTHQKRRALEILQDCSWNRNIRELTGSWQLKYKEPLSRSTPSPLSLLHYNIRHYYSNQADLVEMVATNNPTIISLNKLGTMVPEKTIKQLLFSHHVFTNDGTNSHGGVVIAIDKKIKCLPIEVKEPNIIAVEIEIESRQFVVTSFYSPPTEQLSLTTMTDLVKRSKNVIIVGDMNAKHHDWGCPQVNTKGRALSE